MKLRADAEAVTWDPHAAADTAPEELQRKARALVSSHPVTGRSGASG